MERSLRVVGPEELPQLLDWIRAYFDHDKLTYSASVAEAVAELLEHPEFGSAWFIEVDAKTAGYCVLTYGFDHEAGGRLGIITDFYLDESARGHGLGSWVLHELGEFATSMGLKQMELFVLHHNDGAKRLYDRHEFLASKDREHRAFRLS